MTKRHVENLPITDDEDSDLRCLRLASESIDLQRQLTFVGPISPRHDVNFKGDSNDGKEEIKRQGASMTLKSLSGCAELTDRPHRPESRFLLDYECHRQDTTSMCWIFFRFGS